METQVCPEANRNKRNSPRYREPLSSSLLFLLFNPFPFSSCSLPSPTACKQPRFSFYSRAPSLDFNAPNGTAQKTNWMLGRGVQLQGKSVASAWPSLVQGCAPKHQRAPQGTHLLPALLADVPGRLTLKATVAGTDSLGNRLCHEVSEDLLSSPGRSLVLAVLLVDLLARIYFFTLEELWLLWNHHSQEAELPVEGSGEERPGTCPTSCR